MASFNKVILVGNLTRDPELRYSAKGTAVAKLGVAVNRTWTSETGEKKEETTFVDVDVWGRTAENVSQYLRKGSPLLIEGRLRLETWEDKQTNQKRSKLSVVAESIQFLGSPRAGAEAGAAPAPGRAAAATPAAAAPGAAEPEIPPTEEDDVPF